jgi:hypothetical protein
MSAIPAPLAVVLKTGRAWRDVTLDLRDLSFRNTDPGGYANVQLSLASGVRLPLSRDPDEIDYYGRVFVFDTRTGDTVGEGRIEDLGRTAGSDGQVWDLTAVGPSGHTDDVTRPYIAVDRQYTQFKPSSINKPYVNWQDTNDEQDPGGGLQASVPQGTDLAVSDVDVADNLYQAIFYAGQKVARTRVEWDIGFTDTAWELQIITKTGPTGTKVVACSQTANPAGGSLLGKLTTDGGNIVNGNNCVTFRCRHNGVPNTIPDSLCWFQFNDWSVKTVRFDKSGNEITTGYGGDTVLASQIVEDILARFLPMYDGAGATVTTTSYGIDQMAYYDGVTPRKILDDLMVFEPAYTWHAWESNPVTGLWRFEWVARDTVVSYEADIALDEFDAPSTAADLYDKVRVRYQTTSGNIKNLQRTQTVPQLSAAEFSREGFLDLGSDVGSTNNATQAGDSFLAEHLYPVNAGTVRISRPLVNLQTGLAEQPWELKAGRLIRVRGVDPNIDSLNPAGRNGTTVFKVKSVDFGASDMTAVLELDTYSRATSAALAALSRKPEVRRR